MAEQLKRAIRLPGLVFYGVGTMIGGGIYALLGKIAGITHLLTPWAILFAGLMASFCALSFAELSARYPRSGGPAFYLTKAFNTKIGTLFGWLVISTGVVSAATLNVAVSGFLYDLINLPQWISQLIVIGLLCLVASWGIKQSVTTVAIITLIEVIGLLLVVFLNTDKLAGFDYSIQAFMPDFSQATWLAIFAASFLAFYAFIGFEDMVTLAEEVQGVKKNLPLGIVFSLIITLLLYVAVSFVAVVSVDLNAFAQSNTPMAELVSDNRWISPNVLIVVSLLAGLNGALVQIVMASRILYGMASNQQAPRFFQNISAKTQTPVIATFCVSLIILGLALTTDLTTLAKTTSAIILLVFSGVNLSLVVIKRQDANYQGFEVASWVPITGCFLTVTILIFGLFSSVTAGH